MKITICFFGNLGWEIGNGSIAEVGPNPICGIHGEHSLPVDILTHLHGMGIMHISQIRSEMNSNLHIISWKKTVELGLYGHLAIIWEDYINKLYKAGTSICNVIDSLRWGGISIQDNISVKEIYDFISYNPLTSPSM